MVILLIIKEKKKHVILKFPKDDYILSTSLVLFVNIGAGRPNVSGLNVCAFFSCPAVFSLPLIRPADPSLGFGQLVG